MFWGLMLMRSVLPHTGVSSPPVSVSRKTCQDLRKSRNTFCHSVCDKIYVLTVTSSWMTCMRFFYANQGQVLSQGLSVHLATFTLQGFACHDKGLLCLYCERVCSLKPHACLLWYLLLASEITTTNFHSRAITHWLQIEKRVAFFVTIWYVISLWRIAG